MGKYASEVVKLAQSWIGRKESDGTHKYIIDLYNNGQKKLPRGYKVKYTDSWCATTISSLAISLGYTDIIPTECSCQRMIDRFKEIGCWVENENRIPTPGDIIFYDWQDNGKGDNVGWSDHVGIVVGTAGPFIKVIEGNKDDTVAYRIIPKGHYQIRGFGLPDYASKLP